MAWDKSKARICQNIDENRRKDYKYFPTSFAADKGSKGNAYPR